MDLRTAFYGAMSVSDVYGWSCATTLSLASRSDVLAKRSPPFLASVTPHVQSLGLLSRLSRTSLTRKGFFDGARISSVLNPFLNSYGPRRAQQKSPLRTWKDAHGRRWGARITPPVAGEAAGVVEGENISNCLYLKRSVRSGEVVEHSGTVVVLGDVDPGGRVLADGDVIILGRLRGHAHAGRAGGAITPRIFASAMEPLGLQIFDIALVPTDNDQNPVSKVADLSPDGRIRMNSAFVDAVGKQSVPLSGGRLSRNVQTQQTEGSREMGPARVALGTGIYISVAGLALLAFPRVLFGLLFDLRGVASGWIRVGAVLAVVFGVYYIGTAIGDMRGVHGAEAFYLSTVVGRIFLFVSFSLLVLTGSVPSALLLVGAVNLVGAMLMLKAVRKPLAQKRSSL